MNLIGCLIGSMLLTWVHDFHLSKTQVDILSDSREIRISLHVFTDDLEEALTNLGKGPLNLFSGEEVAEADGVLTDYLSDHLIILVHDRQLTYQLMKKEPSEDGTAVRLFLLIAEVGPVRKITIRNDLLMGLFKDQKNLLSIRVNGQRKDYFMLQQGDVERTVAW